MLYALAMAFEGGNGTELNTPLAYEMYRESAEAGDAYAMKKLAAAYITGEVFPQDPINAAAWNRKAIEAFYRSLTETNGSPEAVVIAMNLFMLLDEHIVRLTNNFTAPLTGEEVKEVRGLIQMETNAAGILNENVRISALANPGVAYLRAGQLYTNYGPAKAAPEVLDIAEQNLTAVREFLGAHPFLISCQNELAFTRIKAFGWDLFDVRGTKYENIFDFPHGLIPEGVWGDNFGSFTAAGYRCPFCGRRLYRTVFPEGNEPVLLLKPALNTFVAPARLFVCYCGRFFATERGRRLNEGVFLQAVVMSDSGSEKERDEFGRWLAFFGTLGRLGERRLD